MTEFIWYCKYCKGIYHLSGLCVFHEINECVKNPKFKYRLQNIQDEKKDDNINNIKQKD